MHIVHDRIAVYQHNQAVGDKIQCLMLYLAGNPDSPVLPGHPDNPAMSGLPQTGQLNWPIPVLTASGLVLVAVGAYLMERSKKREKNA